MKKIDISGWKRKKQFEFFKDYDDPFYNICSEVEITELHKFCKETETSFFIASLYLSQKVMNEIEEFKYRIKEDGVWFYETINAGSTVFNDDETFRFCYFNHFETFQKFYEKSKENLEKSAKENDLAQNPFDENVVFYSVVPWISFSSISHAKKHSKYDSIPRIVFGKYFKRENKLFMPVSIEVHHSLVDGFHVGKYYEKLTEKFQNPQLELL